MDRGVWWATVHGVTKSWTRLRDFTFSVSLLFFDNIAEVVSFYLNGLKKKEALTNQTVVNTRKNLPKCISDSYQLGNSQY